MADFGALLDFDDTSVGVNHVGSADVHLESRGLDPFGTNDLFLDDFHIGTSSSQFGKSDVIFNDDFDPFSKANGPSSDGDYLPEMAKQTNLHQNDQYGDLLGDFGSSGDVYARDEDDAGQRGQGQGQLMESTSSIEAQKQEWSFGDVTKSSESGTSAIQATYGATSHVDDTYDILCAFPESTAPHAEIEDTTIGDDDDWPTQMDGARRRSRGHVTRFDLSATTVHVLTPSPSDDDLESKQQQQQQTRGTWPITFIDGDDQLSGMTCDADLNVDGEDGSDDGLKFEVEEDERRTYGQYEEDDDDEGEVPVSSPTEDGLMSSPRGCTVTTIWSLDVRDGGSHSLTKIGGTGSFDANVTNVQFDHMIDSGLTGSLDEDAPMESDGGYVDEEDVEAEEAGSPDAETFTSSKYLINQSWRPSSSETSPQSPHGHVITQQNEDDAESDVQNYQQRKLSNTDNDVENGEANRWSQRWTQPTDNSLEHHVEPVKSIRSPTKIDMNTSESQSAAVARRSQSREKRQQELSSRIVNDENACRQCGKRVYPMEMITADEVVYHKSCFRCSHCNRVLSLLNYSAIDGQMFCKPHFLEMFKLKGNYADGFKAGNRPQENGDGFEHEEQLRTSVQPSSQWNNTDADETADYPQQDAREEIPTVPLRQVRNIFENLAQGSPSQQPVFSPSSQLTRDKSVERRVSRENTPNVVKQEREQTLYTNEADLGDREVVQGTSTVYVIEEELPPPAITRSILAKFRELESTHDGKAVPVPSRVPSTGTGGAGTPPRVPAGSKRVVDIRDKDDRHSQHYNGISGTANAYQNGDVLDRDERSYADDVDYSLTAATPTTPVDELPQQGIAKNLLARWRTIEQQSQGRGRDESSSAKRSSPARRSQSTSRVEVKQRSRGNYRQSSDEDDDVDNKYRVADYLNVHNKLELENLHDSDHPPALMTRQVLAKFRSMEDRSLGHQQPQLQRQRSFRWEVKEAVPLSRGNLVVHGDVPKRSLSEYERVNSVDSPDENTSALHEEELPAPSTTRNLLTLFKSMEDHTALPPTPERSEKSRESVARSDSRTWSHPQSPRSAADYEQDGLVRSNGVDFEGAVEAGEFENQPVHDPSLVRESDRMDETEFPERGTTRGLLAKFQLLQQSK